MPVENASEASIIPDISVIPVKNLQEAADFLTKNKSLENHDEITKIFTKNEEIFIDFASIIGQESAKRAMIIAAAGGHNIILQ